MSARSPDQAWFEKAEQHLEMARRAMDSRNALPDMACYHCQQCAEKYLNGFLISNSEDFLFVHDLIYLVHQCEKRFPAFLELERAADILGRYGAGVRYPMESFVSPDVEEAMNAIKLAENIATFVKNNL